MNSPKNYRGLAKDRVEGAKAELGGENSARPKYAALELRMAIEAVTYDGVFAYREEIQPAEFGKWQPKRLMQVLIDIDPTADQTSTISFSEEITPGVPTKHLFTLGTDKVFSLGTT